MSKRITWLDVAKFFGMLFIYIGHFGNISGLLYSWVFAFHVPLFFFLSGCVENYNTKSFFENIKAKFISLVIPFFFFGLLVIIVDVLTTNSPENILPSVVVLLKGGIRNDISLANGLWFLPCLFVIECLFSLIKQMKYKTLILGACFLSHLGASYLITPSPIVDPHWLWNIDSALYYIIFYCLGWLLYSPLNHFFTLQSKKMYFILFDFLTLYSGLLFLGKDLLIGLTHLSSFFAFIENIFSILFLILWVVFLSILFQDRLLFQNLGKSSLYLCGNEYIIKFLMSTLLSILGLSLKLQTPFEVLIYSFILTLLVVRFIVPIEKPLLSNLQKNILS